MGKVEVDGGGDVYVAVKAHDGVNDEVNLKVGDPDRTLCSTLLEPDLPTHGSVAAEARRM